MFRSLEPRGRSREEAAAYIGVGVTKFDMLVAAGRMPQPRAVDRRRIWCVRELDTAFESLPRIGATQQPGAVSVDWQDLAH